MERGVRKGIGLTAKTLKAVEVVSDMLSWVARKKVGIPTERADWFRYDKVGSRISGEAGVYGG